jgi:sugar O-acyltransferase (sialic acid O-acetyltransferase NeuD family)
MDLYIFGAGQIGEVAAYYFAETSGLGEIRFVVDDEYRVADVVDGIPVLAWTEAVAIARRGSDRWFTAMSAKRRSAPRQERAAMISDLGFEFASYIHPTATAWRGFSMPANSMILENNTLQYKSALGPNSIVWSNSHIGHHTTVGANTFITSEVVISGNCTIGDNTFFGVNATVFDGISIGSRAVIGAGAIIREDVGERTVVR